MTCGARFSFIKITGPSKVAIKDVVDRSDNAENPDALTEDIIDTLAQQLANNDIASRGNALKQASPKPIFWEVVRKSMDYRYNGTRIRLGNQEEFCG